MKLRFAIAVLFLVLLQSFVHAQKLQRPYQLDTKKSKILWNTGKMMGGHSGYILFTWGNLEYSQAGDPIKGVFFIDMNTIRSTENKQEINRRKTDSIMRTPRFFASDQFPTALVNVKTIKRVDKSSNFNVTADLIIKGISHPIDFVARIDARPDSASIKANIGINHVLWNINEQPQPFKVDLSPRAKEPAAPDIYVSLDLVLVR